MYGCTLPGVAEGWEQRATASVPGLDTLCARGPWRAEVHPRAAHGSLRGDPAHGSPRDTRMSPIRLRSRKKGTMMPRTQLAITSM